MNWRDVRDSVRRQGLVDRWQVDGRWFATRTLGEGPLLFLPGQAGGSSETLCLLAWLLREEFRCVMVDLPAVPGRRAGSGEPVLSQPAADLLQVMRRTDAEPGLMYACGLTGLAAIAAAGRAAERFTGLVLQSVPLGVRLAGVERWLARVGRLAPGVSCAAIPGFRTVLRQNHRGWFPPGAEDRWDYQVAEATSIRMKDFCRRVLLSDSAAAEFDQFGGDAWGLSADERIPLLLLRTEGDGQVLAAAADRLAEVLPGARTGWVGGCGQLPYLTHPHRMARILREFAESAGVRQAERGENVREAGAAGVMQRVTTAGEADGG